MYEKAWGSDKPGHLLILIDQSGSMEYDNRQNKVVEAVQDALDEMLTSCTKGNEIKNRAFITIIGYGGRFEPTSNANGYICTNEVDILKSDWISDLADEIAEASLNNTTIIKPKADGLTPMGDAFRLAKQCIEKFNEAQGSDVYNYSVVLNITDGYPEVDGYKAEDAFEDARQAAMDIMNISSPEGSPLLFNLHISNEGNESKLPLNDSALDEYGKFLYSITSPLPKGMVATAKGKGFETAVPGCKGLCVNAKGNTVARFISFGSDQ